MIFCTTLYGNDYVKFLYAQIGSIKRNSPESEHYIIYNSVDNEYLDPLKEDRKIKVIRLSEIVINQQQDLSKIISSKVHFWNAALNYLPDKPVIMLDVDTLINFNFYKTTFDFDLGFTIKKERYPLNTGVIYLKNSPEIRSFFNKWADTTIEIINNPTKLAISTSNEHPYGGADQMSFQNIIKYDVKKGSFKTNYNGLKFASLECEIYNQTNSVPYDKSVKIYHYKGGWHNVINKGYSFNKKRTLKDSFSLLIYFNNCLDYFTNKYKITNLYTSLNLPYLKRGKVNRLKYIVHYIFYLSKKIAVSLIRKVFPKFKQIRI